MISLPEIDRERQRRRITRMEELHPPTVPVRERLRAFVERCAVQFDLKDPFLDVGCGFRTSEPEVCRDRLRDYYTCDLNPAWEPGFVVAAEDLTTTFGRGVFGTVICTELLEHTRDPFKVVTELRGVVRPGGHLLVSVPFWVPVHRKPPFQEDYWRFTPDGFLLMMSGLATVAIETIGPGDRPEGIFGLFT